MIGKTLNTDTAVAADAERDTEMTEKITREEIEALLKLADAATPGPWERRETEVPIGDTGDHDVSFSISPVGSQAQIICQYWDGLSDDEPNLTYIAAANPAVLKALCTLALQALDMEPRPIEEAPKEGNFIGFLEDGRACTMSWRQHIKNWKPIEGGGYVPDGYHWLTCEEDHDSYTPRKAIAWMPFPPLTSLPEPRR